MLPGFGPGPVDTYELTTPALSASPGRAARTQILIPEPSALKALDGENIAVRPTPGSVQFLDGARWSDRLPLIVQARLVEAFQHSGRVSGVGKPGEGLAIDYQIVTDIRAFDIRVDEARERAEVEIFVRVLDDRNGVVRAARSFTASAPAIGAGSEALAAALDRAFASAAADIVDWTASTF